MNSAPLKFYNAKQERGQVENILHKKQPKIKSFYWSQNPNYARAIYGYNVSCTFYSGNVKKWLLRS